MNNLCNDKIDLVSFNQETDAEHANEIGISHITEMQIPEFLRKYKITNSNTQKMRTFGPHFFIMNIIYPLVLQR